jgi:hypothetical protein
VYCWVSERRASDRSRQSTKEKCRGVRRGTALFFVFFSLVLPSGSVVARIVIQQDDDDDDNEHSARPFRLGTKNGGT